jgi:hypothetical protein
MTIAAEKVEAFLAEIRGRPKFVAAHQAGDARTAEFWRVEELLRWLCVTDIPAAVDACDAVSEVLAGGGSVKQRLDALLPILTDLRNKFPRKD